MKKILAFTLIILSLFACFTLGACSDDDDRMFRRKTVDPYEKECADCGTTKDVDYEFLDEDYCGDCYQYAITHYCANCGTDDEVRGITTGDEYSYCYNCYYDLVYGDDYENSCYRCGTSYKTGYTYDGKEYCWDCYYEEKYSDDTECFLCGDSDADYEYAGYDLCWDCYYDLEYSGDTECYDCGTTYEVYYTYGGEDYCWDCYYDAKYGSSSSSCYICGDSYADYDYYGYDLCWDCYYDLEYN